MPTEDHDLVKARETADSICRWTRPQLRRQVIAALLRARADGIEWAGGISPDPSNVAAWERLRALEESR